MASATSLLSFSCSKHLKPPIISSFPFPSSYKISNHHHVPSITHLFTSFLTSWNSFSHLGISLRQGSHRQEKKRRWRAGVVYSSLFGVGAPEALVIGVVALLVFGPKGLAEVARNLGKTLRAFQPTIRELQEVSREFKSTLEREIGLDEVPPSVNNTYNPGSQYMKENPQTIIDQSDTTTRRPYSSEDYLKITEEQLKATAVEQQKQTTILEEQPQASPKIVSASDPADTTESERSKNI